HTYAIAFLHSCSAPRHLLSFPTRRSSDLPLAMFSWMVLKGHRIALSALGIAASAAGLAVATRSSVKPYAVYHDGANLQFSPEATGTHRLAHIGPWNLGERLDLDDEKPRDKRLNLYV